MPSPDRDPAAGGDAPRPDPQPSEHDGRYWSITVLGAGSGTVTQAAPFLEGAKRLGLQVEGGAVQIKDRVSGEVGTFALTGASVGVAAIPLEVELPSGEPAYFQTKEPKTVGDFEGPARITGASAAPLAQLKMISFSDDLNWPGGLDMDLEHDSFVDTVILGDAVDISKATNGVALEATTGAVQLTLISTHVEEPDPGLFDEAPGIVAHGREVAEHHLGGQTADLEHAAAEVDAQQSLPWPESPAHDPETLAHAADMAERTHDAAEAEAQQSLPDDQTPSADDLLYDAWDEVNAQQSHPSEAPPDPGPDEPRLQSVEGGPPIHEAIADDIRDGLDTAGSQADPAGDDPAAGDPTNTAAHDGAGDGPLLYDDDGLGPLFGPRGDDAPAGSVQEPSASGTDGAPANDGDGVPPDHSDVATPDDGLGSLNRSTWTSEGSWLGSNDAQDDGLGGFTPEHFDDHAPDDGAGGFTPDHAPDDGLDSFTPAHFEDPAAGSASDPALEGGLDGFDPDDAGYCEPAEG